MVTVRVEHGDVLDRTTDLLVLKYAQGLYGVDAAAYGRIGALDPNGFPDVGQSMVLLRPTGVAARSLVFVGVPPLPAFGYAEIRRFGHDAVLAAVAAGARDVCLTVHGTGYGLDEAESFRAEVAGVFDAIDLGDASRIVVQVTVVDIDGARVERLRGLLDEILRERARPGSAHVVTAGLDSDRKRHAFVAMPFTEEFEDRFHFGIRPPLADVGMLSERMDQIHFTGNVVAMMERRIRDADVVVADLSTANPNVYLEVGYAWAARRPTILLLGEHAEPRFDVQGHRYLRYSSIRDLEKKLRAELTGLGW